jgi:hypothetical protein
MPLRICAIRGGKNININRSLEEVESKPQDSVEEVTADVVEMAKELYRIRSGA